MGRKGNKMKNRKREDIEKRREKRKIASRARRKNQKIEFQELIKVLPLPHDILSNLLKVSTIRLTTAYIRLRQVFPDGFGDGGWGELVSSSPLIQSSTIPKLGSRLVKALEGFVFALASDGKILYISETACVHLGISHVELMGSSIYEYIHPDDSNEMIDMLSSVVVQQTNIPTTTMQKEFKLERAFVIRIKCFLDKKSAGLTNADYKMVHCNGYLKLKLDMSDDGALTPRIVGLVAFGQTLPSFAMTEIRIHSNMFIFRTLLDLKLVSFDARGTFFTGYHQQGLVYRSFYQFIHGCDLRHMHNSHTELLQKGQVTTKYYRFLTKNGGWVWMQSVMTIPYHPRSPNPQVIVSVNYVLSCCEASDVILAEEQMGQQQREDDNRHNTTSSSWAYLPSPSGGTIAKNPNPSERYNNVLSTFLSSSTSTSTGNGECWNNNTVQTPNTQHNNNNNNNEPVDLYTIPNEQLLPLEYNWPAAPIAPLTYHFNAGNNPFTSSSTSSYDDGNYLMQPSTSSSTPTMSYNDNTTGLGEMSSSEASMSDATDTASETESTAYSSLMEFAQIFEHYVSGNSNVTSDTFLH